MVTATTSSSHVVPTPVPCADVTFPADCVVGSIGDFARTMASGSEVPEELYLAAGLTMLGHMCASNLQLENDLDVRPQLYAVLLGNSGEVKKSIAMRKTIEFFESLAWNGYPKISYGVGSAEGLASDFSERQDILISYDELRSFIDKCGVQSFVLLPMVASLCTFLFFRIWHRPVARHRITARLLAGEGGVRFRSTQLCSTAPY